MNLAQLAHALDMIDHLSFFESSGKLNSRCPELDQLPRETVQRFAEELNFAIQCVKEELFEEVKNLHMKKVVDAKLSSRH